MQRPFKTRQPKRTKVSLRKKQRRRRALQKVKTISSSSDESIRDYKLNRRSETLICSSNLKEDACFIDSSLSSEGSQEISQHKNEKAQDISKEFCINDSDLSPEIQTHENTSFVTNSVEEVLLSTRDISKGCSINHSFSSDEGHSLENNCVSNNVEDVFHSWDVCTNVVNNSTTINFSGNNFESDLRKYAVFAKTPHAKLRPLLSLLRLYNFDVPVDPRTLLRTPRSTEVKQCQYGEYKHFGLIESIQNILNKNIDVQLPEILNLGIGIDDVPTYKGISITFILGCMDEIQEVFIIGMTVVSVTYR